MDKPPLGLWIQVPQRQALSASLGVSLIRAGGVGGRRLFVVVPVEPRAAQRSGPRWPSSPHFLLTISPAERCREPRQHPFDSLLVFALLAGGVVGRRPRDGARPVSAWLVAGGVLVGLAFNIKMLQAFLIVPALVLLFLLGARLPWWKRCTFLGVMLAAMLLVSLSWVQIVDHTPAAQRPYVGSSTTNSEMELVLGYNTAFNASSVDHRRGRRIRTLVPARSPRLLSGTQRRMPLGWL